MTVQERIQDISGHLGIESDELNQVFSHTGNLFKSIEFYNILHATNEELFYMPDEHFSAIEEACEITAITENGKIWAFK